RRSFFPSRLPAPDSRRRLSDPPRQNQPAAVQTLPPESEFYRTAGLYHHRGIVGTAGSFPGGHAGRGARDAGKAHVPPGTSGPPGDLPDDHGSNVPEISGSGKRTGSQAAGRNGTGTGAGGKRTFPRIPG